MAKTIKKETKEKDPQSDIKILKTKKQYRMLFGFLLILLSIAFLVSFISFFVSDKGVGYGQADQSAVDSLTDRSQHVENWLGKFGAYIADFIHPEFHERIGFIKDIAAGAVMFTAIASIVVGLLIYVPKFL